MNCSLKWNGRHSSSRALKWDASSHARSRSALTRAHAGGTRMRAARAPPFQHGMARGALLPTPSPGSSFFHAHSRDTRFSIRVQGVHGGGGGGAPTVCCPCVAGWPPGCCASRQRGVTQGCAKSIPKEGGVQQCQSAIAMAFCAACGCGWVWRPTQHPFAIFVRGRGAPTMLCVR